MSRPQYCRCLSGNWGGARIAFEERNKKNVNMNSGNQEKTERMGTEKISHLLIRMAVPAVVAQVVNLLYNIVDRIYIGHIPEIGVPALTGVGLVTPMLMLVTAFSMFIGSGGAPLASIALGERDNQRANRIVGVCSFGLISLSVLLTVCLQLTAPRLLRFFGASDATLPYALEYSRIYIFGTIAVMIALGMNPFISGQGFAGTAMLTTVIGAAINIALDPLLIFVFHMGVKGAAIATVFSQVISALWVVLFLSGKKPTIHLQWINIRPDWPLLGQCAALGVSSLIMVSTESLLSIIFNRSLSIYGGDLAVGAMTIITCVNAIVFMPLQGVAQGVQPIMSYNFGARRYRRVTDSFRLALIVNVMYSVICWALVQFSAANITGIFTNDPTLRDYAVWAIRIYFACIFTLSFQITCQYGFIALGQARLSLCMAVLRKIILLIPLILILPRFLPDQVFAVFIAEPVSDVIAAVTTTLLFFLTMRRTLQL